MLIRLNETITLIYVILLPDQVATVTYLIVVIYSHCVRHFCVWLSPVAESPFERHLVFVITIRHPLTTIIVYDNWLSYFNRYYYFFKYLIAHLFVMATIILLIYDNHLYLWQLFIFILVTTINFFKNIFIIRQLSLIYVVYVYDNQILNLLSFKHLFIFIGCYFQIIIPFVYEHSIAQNQHYWNNT